MILPHKIQYGISQELYFYLGKNADFFFSIFCEVPRILCGSKSKSRFSVCVTSVAHTFLLQGESRYGRKETVRLSVKR